MTGFVATLLLIPVAALLVWVLCCSWRIRALPFPELGGDGLDTRATIGGAISCRRCYANMCQTCPKALKGLTKGAQRTF